MKTIRALIFDYGGVISQPQNQNHVDNMFRILRHSPPDFMDVYRKFRGDYDNGQFSGEEYWLTILQHYGYQLSESEIDELISEDTQSWTKINNETLDFITDTRKRVHNLSIISNMPPDTLSYMRKHFKWLDIFDELTFSCEIGVNKPDPAIYEHCIDRIGIHPSQCLFVDDSIENVKGAKRTGMNAIHFTSYAKFFEELDRTYQISND